MLDNDWDADSNLYRLINYLLHVIESLLNYFVISFDLAFNIKIVHFNNDNF